MHVYLPNGGELQSISCLWLSRSWGWLVHCLSVYHLPGGEMGPWFWPSPDYVIMCVLCVKSWLYCNVTAMCCAPQALKVDYIVRLLPCDVLIRLGWELAIFIMYMWCAQLVILPNNVTEHIHGPLWSVSLAELAEQSWLAKPRNCWYGITPREAM